MGAYQIWIMGKLIFLHITVSRLSLFLNELWDSYGFWRIDNTVFAKTTTPPGNRGLWFSFALTDPALFHTTLFISASHLSASQKKPALPAFFQHRGEVIRIVNNRLRKSTAAAATDGTIGAVAGLSIADVCSYFSTSKTFVVMINGYIESRRTS